MSKRGKYDQLPQSNESDSDFDIFDAKSQPILKKHGLQQDIGCNKKIWITFFVLLVIIVIIGVVCGILVPWSHDNIPNAVPIVSTLEAGRILGIRDTVTVDGRSSNVYRFNGIPYAEPPIGNKRWSPPVPKAKFTKTYTADKEKICCIQYEGTSTEKTKEPSEDCLYLHVLTPNLDVKAKLPVLVWFHGGYSLNGFSDMYGYSPDSEFVSSMNIVAVNVNFRLNAFGYLSLKQLWKTNVSYGNYGMMDQILALQWVQQNIVNFGGDPNSVTLVGQSSGGTSILALIASPKADGLFHKVISMSGSPYFPKTYQDASNDNKKFLERNMSKCVPKTTPINLQRECLYNLTVQEILDSIPGYVFPYWAMDDLLNFPSYGRKDGALFVLDPIVLPYAPQDLKGTTGMKTNISVLIGNTAQEVGIGVTRLNTSELLKSIENKLKEFHVDYASVKDAYSTVFTSSVDNETIYETLITDVRTSCANNNLTKMLRRNPRFRNTYRYVVTYKPSEPLILTGPVRGHNAFHALDAFSLFGMKIFKDYTPTKQDQQFIETIRNTVKHFMIYGTIEGASPKGTILFAEDGNLKFNASDYHEEQCKIWDQDVFRPYAWIN